MKKSKCPEIEKLRQSFESFKQKTEKQFADMGRKIKMNEEQIPYVVSKPKPDYVSHYVNNNFTWEREDEKDA